MSVTKRAIHSQYPTAHVLSRQTWLWAADGNHGVVVICSTTLGMFGVLGLWCGEKKNSPVVVLLACWPIQNLLSAPQQLIYTSVNRGKEYSPASEKKKKTTQRSQRKVLCPESYLPLLKKGNKRFQHRRNVLWQLRETVTRTGFQKVKWIWSSLHKKL